MTQQYNRKKARESAQHKWLVRLAVDIIEEKTSSEKIMADLSGYEQPPIIRRMMGKLGHRPDVLGGGFIVEAETEESLCKPHAESQLRLFAAYAQQHNLTLVLVVPSAVKNEAITCLNHLDLDGDVWHAKF